jgi:5'-methylthioadenosine phosphorylase
MDTKKNLLGIIGGSIGHELAGFILEEEFRQETPFGQSTTIFKGKIKNRELLFLSRHEKGHLLDPSHVPYRADIYALKELGCTHILSITAVGSLKEKYAPGNIIIPDQIIDKTNGRGKERSFFGEGIVAHVDVSEPFCKDFSKQLFRISNERGPSFSKGCYICMEGPQFSTKAESKMHRKWGGDIIGMTVSPEYRLCREAELCYAALALITDYDVWRQGEEVSVGKVKETIAKNNLQVAEIIKCLVHSKLSECRCGCTSALECAIQTNQNLIAVNSELKNTHNLFLKKYGY